MKVEEGGRVVATTVDEEGEVVEAGAEAGAANVEGEGEQ